MLQNENRIFSYTVQADWFAYSPTLFWITKHIFPFSRYELMFFVQEMNIIKQQTSSVKLKSFRKMKAFRLFVYRYVKQAKREIGNEIIWLANNLFRTTASFSHRKIWILIKRSECFYIYYFAKRHSLFFQICFHLCFYKTWIWNLNEGTMRQAYYMVVVFKPVEIRSEVIQDKLSTDWTRSGAKRLTWCSKSIYEKEIERNQKTRGVRFLIWSQLINVEDWINREITDKSGKHAHCARYKA